MAGLNMDIRADIREVERMLGNLAREVLPKAATRAVNKTLRPVQSAAVKTIAKDIGVKQKFVRQATKVKRASFANLSGFVEASGKRLPIIQIDPKAKQDATGVSYKSHGGRQHIPHAFVARMKSGHEGVFKRLGKARLPITELRGPSIPKVFLENATIKAMDTTANLRWLKNFNHEINFELMRRGYA